MKILKVTLLLLANLLFAFSRIGWTYPAEVVYTKPQDIIQLTLYKPKDKYIVSQGEYNPSLYEYYYSLGLQYEFEQDYEKELEALKLCIQYLPDDVEEKEAYYGNLARVYFLTGRYKQAREWLNKADEINPQNIINRNNSLLCYIETQDFDGAAKELKFLEEKGDNKTDYYFDAWIYAVQNLKNTQKALEMMKKAIDTNPKSYKAHRAYAIALRTTATTAEEYKTNLLDVIKELKKALELNDKYIPTYISLGCSYLYYSIYDKQNPYLEEAKQWFDKAYKLAPDNFRLAYVTGKYFFYKKDYDSAIKKLEFAYKANPENQEFKKDLIAVYEKKAETLYGSGKDYEDALRWIEKAIKLSPKDDTLRKMKGEILDVIHKEDDTLSQ